MKFYFGEMNQMRPLRIRNAARPSDGRLHSGEEGEKEGRRNCGKGNKTSDWKEEEREESARERCGETRGSRSCVTRARACTRVPRVRTDDVGVCRSK